MTFAPSFIRSSLLALGLVVAATGAFADSGHRSAEPTPICQTCQPHNDERPDQPRRAEPDHRPGMVPAVAHPYRMAPPPAVAPARPQVPGIVILLGSL